MSIQKESARDKQIATFGKRERLVSAALEYAAACVHAGRVRYDLRKRLIDAARAYKPTRFESRRNPLKRCPGCLHMPGDCVCEVRS